MNNNKKNALITGIQYNDRDFIFLSAKELALTIEFDG
jgi:hypothetical protein